MRARNFLAAIAAAALLWGTPLISQSVLADKYKADKYKDKDKHDHGGWRGGYGGDWDDDDWDDDDYGGNWNRGSSGYYALPGGFSIGGFSTGVRPCGYGYGFGPYRS